MPDLQTASINITSLGSHVVIPGSSTATTIQVVGIYFQCSVATCLTIKGGSVSFTGPMSYLSGGNGTFSLGSNVYFQVNNGDDFIFNLSGLTGQVAGIVYYYQL